MFFIITTIVYISAVLIPLFGLHFIISAFVPTDSYTPYGAKSVFDSIQAVIFIASLAEYDQVLAEDGVHRVPEGFLGSLVFLRFL